MYPWVLHWHVYQQGSCVSNMGISHIVTFFLLDVLLECKNAFFRTEIHIQAVTNSSTKCWIFLCERPPCIYQSDHPKPGL